MMGHSALNALGLPSMCSAIKKREGSNFGQKFADRYLKKLPTWGRGYVKLLEKVADIFYERSRSMLMVYFQSHYR